MLQEVTHERASLTSAGIALEVRFFLTDAELKEVLAVRKTVSNSLAGKAVGRVVTGIGAVLFFIVFPSRFGGWQEMLVSSPLLAVFFFALGILELWITVGSPGLAKLNRAFNRLGVERHIRFSDRGVLVTHGGKTLDYQWEYFRFFQETPNLFVLQTVGTSFWTVPKRVLPPNSTQQLRAFLVAKLPQK